ncbi:MAG: T9SS type A sorting domain-containing protein [Candidatus Delongbacteria bacterium]
MKALSILLVGCLGLGSSALASSTNPAGTRLPSQPGQYGHARTSQEVLVVRDYQPWGGDVVPRFTERGVNVTVASSMDLRTADLSTYCLVYVTGAMTENGDDTSLNLNSLAARNNLAAYVTDGGAVLYNTASLGATLRLPGGVNSAVAPQSYNLFPDVNPLSAGMPFPLFEGGMASHDSLMNLPGTTLSYITDLDGHVTGADYPVGAGRVLALTQPFEYYLGDGAGTFPHMLTLLDNALGYALSMGQCDGQVVPGELSLSMDAISAFGCTDELYNPAAGDLALTITNVGGSACQGITATLLAGTGLQAVGSPVQGADQLLPGESITLTFQVAPLGTPCDESLHYDLLVDCATCPALATSGMIWVPCCGVVDALDAPRAFELRGNHPNPFNPVTTIDYSLSVTTDVRLSVFSLTGERVATLVDGPQAAGAHRVSFDASQLSSGLYLYRLEAEGRTLTGRMLLIK